MFPTIRYVALAGYDGACQCQIEPKDGNDSQYVKYNHGDCIPIAFDLSKQGLKEGQQFRLHSKRNDQHIHSDYYEYPNKGGMLYGGIVDNQAHFSTLSAVGP